MATVARIDLTGLLKRDAWTLFKEHAFKEKPKQIRDPRNMIGKEIAKKCEGKPEILKSAASYLSSVASLDEWSSFNNSFGAGMAFPEAQQPSSPGDGVVFPPLENNMDSLTSDFKESLAYNTLLAREQGQRIDVEMLCKLWMEHGKIILMDPYGETLHERVRHVILNFNLDTSWQIPNSLLKASRLRTIWLSAQTRLSHEEKLSKSTCHAIFSYFKRLRVLDLHDLGMKTVPNSLGKLKHLRYLDLSKNSFAELPRATTTLLNLQTWKLNDCYKLKELPAGINMMVSLRHLEIDGCFALTHMPQGVGDLTSLETLSSFVVSNKYSSNPNNLGGLEELYNLNNLRGGLEISHLEITPQRLAENNPFLSQKQHLQRLTLRWEPQVDADDDWDSDDDDDDGDNKYDYAEILLEYLQPHRNLKELSIIGFTGVKFSNWVFTLPHLVKLSLYNCPRCNYLPPLHHLTTLEVLELGRMEDLEYIADYTEFLFPFETTTPPPFFPSLKSLTIWDCPDLISWWKISTGIRPVRTLLPPKCIQRLDILFCPKLRPIPFYPEYLFLMCPSVNQLEQMMIKMTESLPSSSSSTPVEQGLKTLDIFKVEELESLPEERLKGFTSLENLRIRDCPQLKSLSEGLQHLSSLRYLTIENCSELVLSKAEDDKKGWEGLRSLRSLTIEGIPKLEALPEGLSNATSLEVLKLSKCHALMSLPEWIRHLISLDRLEIVDCPKLLPKCQPVTGEDWPKIADIKNISAK